MKKETLRKAIIFLLNTLTEFKMEGVEHIPAQGGLIIATNHLSRFDIPVLFANPVRPEITALVADKYKSHLFFRWFAASAGGIWIDRSRADVSAFRDAIAVLRAGGAVGISPEGTRSTTGQLLEGKSGTALLALKAGVPILPVGIFGTEDTYGRLARFQRPHITARFGPAFSLEPLGREEREAGLKRYTDEIMCRIAALLPPPYRGFYANHPRLQEFLPGV